MSLTLGELSGIISLNEKPAMAALGRARQGMRDTAAEGQRSTDKLDAQQQKYAASVESASERVNKARQRESVAVRALGAAEVRLSEAKKKGVDGDAKVVAAQARLAAAHQRVRASQDATAKSTRDFEVAQERLATSTNRNTRRVSLDFHKMAESVSSDGTRSGRAVSRGTALIVAGLTAILPAAGAGGAALVATAGGALTLAASLKQLVGVAALAPAGLAAVGAGAGVLLAAFNGMGEALKTATEQTSASAGSARLDAMALADAARAVTQAERAAAEQQVDAARRVEDAKRALRRVVEDNAEQQAAAVRRVAFAERDVESANRRVEESQRDLNDARAEAVLRVDDLNRSLEQAGLSEREASLRYEDALAAFNEGVASGADTGSREMRRLQLDLDQAALGLTEAKEETADLRKEQATATREGVKGNKQVISAEQALADARLAANDAVVARQEAIADVAKTERENADRAIEAQEAITDASEGAARAQVDAAESVADAYRNLERVQVQQAEAAAAASEKSVAAMDELTPSAQLAALALLDVYRRLGGIRRIAQENYFNGFSEPLLELADVLLPQLETGVGALATALGEGAQKTLRALTRSLGGGVAERILLNIADAADVLNDAIDPVVDSIVTLTDVGSEYLPDLSAGIRDAADEFNDFIQGAAADGSLRGWIDDGIQGTKDLFSVLGSVVGILDALEDAARAGGIDTTIGGVADGLDRIEETMRGGDFQDTMSTIFGGAKGGAEGLLAALGPIGEAFKVGGPALAEFLRLGGEIAGMFIGDLFTGLSDPGFGSGLTTFLEGVRGGVEDLGPKLPGLFDALGDILTAVAPVVEAFGPTAVDVLTAFAEGFGAILGFAEPLMTELAGSPALIGTFIAVIGASAVLSTMGTFAGNLQAIAVGFRAIWAAASGPVGWIVAGIALVSAATIWWLTETETGQKFVKDSAWDLFNAWQDISWLYENILKPRMINAVLDISSAFQTVKVATARGMVTLRNGATDLALWWGIRFASMKTSSTRSMLDIVSGALGLKKDLETYMSAIGVALDLVPGYFEAAVDGAMVAWNLLKAEAKKPVSFVINDVINDGLIAAFRLLPGINEKNMPDVSVPGFRDGGYTGDGGVNEAAGVVHGKEFVVNAAATAAIGKENLAEMSHAAVHGGAAATVGEGNIGGFFQGNAAAIGQHGAYYMSVAQGMGGWDFPGAAKLWDGAAGVKVKIGTGKHQGHVYPRERGGGILGYTTGTDIDMSPSWMNQLGETQRRTVAAHEMGHALGLPHNSLNSIMQPNLGNMASVPTALDIRNLQSLYPGGSGKAGSPDVPNPFEGMVEQLISEFRAAFPSSGMFVDGTAGVATSGINEVIDWVQSIKETATSVGEIGVGVLTDKAGDIASDVVGNIREFFGGGAATVAPTLMDGGGMLYNTGGPQLIDHRRSKPDRVLSDEQWNALYKAAANGSAGGVTYAPVFQASSFEEQERHARRMFDEYISPGI
ncbi:matrixin family metalloprotease [Arthrobacter sp. N1]|uniref:matrixin family metalloprotease n=1 Tax=Arthrobacter sp. N1 TaxID=619291 RepID=UPI003BAE5674